MSDEEREEGGLPAVLRDPLGLLKRRWPWMLSLLVIGSICTVLYVISLPVQYMAATTVLVSSQQIPERFVESTVPDDAFDRVNALIGEILSRDRLTAIIEQYDLYPDLRKSQPLVDVVSQVRSQVNIGMNSGIGPRTRDQTSSIYAITFRHEDPRKAAAVANHLASDFVAASSRMRSQQARLTTQFMTQELTRTESELRELEAKVTEFKEAHRGELPSELNANLSKLDRLSAQRQTIGMQITEAEGQLGVLVESNTTDATSPQARLALLRAQLAEAQSVFTDEHPNVISLQRQIATLQEQIDSGQVSEDKDLSREVMIRTAQKRLDDLHSLQSRVEAEINEREKHVAATPQREEELKGMEDRVAVLRDTYLQNLRKVRAAELAESLESAQQGERVSVLDRAIPPREPENRRMKYFFMGLMATLGLAGLAGLAPELWDPVLVDSQAVEELGVPVLGAVPRIG